MLSLCLNCKKNTENKNTRVLMSKVMLLSICTMCDSKKSKFIK